MHSQIMPFFDSKGQASVIWTTVEGIRMRISEMKGKDKDSHYYHYYITTFRKSSSFNKTRKKSIWYNY